MRAPSRSAFFRHLRPGFLAALMLAWFWCQVITVSPELGITADEAIHLTAGYEYWRQGDYRMQPENGNLPQRVVALPLLWLQPDSPPVSDPDMVKADVWGMSHRFFFHQGNQPGLMIFLGRIMIALVGVATGVLVYAWAKALWGPIGGLIATAFFTTSPNLLAHAGLVTSDMMASFGFLGATLAGWRLLHRVTPGRTVVFGLALGGLALAKFSAPLFVFVFAGMVAIRLCRRAPVIVAWGASRARWRGWHRFMVLGTGTAIAVLIAYAVLWSAYGFRYSAAKGDQPAVFLLKWEYLLGQDPYTLQLPVPEGIEPFSPVDVRPNFVRSAVQWSRDHHALPEAYLWGFAYVYTYSQWRPAFFLGEYRTTGWRAYFPVSVLLKTPLATLALGLFAAVLLGRLHRYVPQAFRWWYRLSPLLIFVVIYGLFAVYGHLNIGIRHLLPAECALCIVGGVLACACSRWPRTAPAAFAVLFLTAWTAGWSARPSYLAFFNLLAGGPNKGYAYLADSSLDWGQGLPRLSAWLAKHRGNERVYLTYFGSDSPYYENLRVTRIGDGFFDREPIFLSSQIHPGIYAVSATLLQGVYSMAPGPWTEAYEQAYQTRLQRAFAGVRADLPPNFWLEFDQLRFGRLRHFLLERNPDAQPDPSILIYRLSAEDLSKALGYRVR